MRQKRIMPLAQARDVLEIHGIIVEEEIKVKFKLKALLHHPDKGGDHKKFIEVTEARKTLLKHIGQGEAEKEKNLGTNKTSDFVDWLKSSSGQASPFTAYRPPVTTMIRSYEEYFHRFFPSIHVRIVCWNEKFYISEIRSKIFELSDFILLGITTKQVQESIDQLVFLRNCSVSNG